VDDYATLSNSAVARTDLLRSVTYPDGGVVSYEYNRQGQVTQMTDQNGTVHQYAYDLLGRPTADSVITLGTGIDGAVRRIAHTYNTAGLPQNVTSYSAATGGTVANDIQYQYNGFQQLTAEYQSHSGAVNTSSTPAVQYNYASGADNTVRLTEITYPAGNGPSYEYGAAGGDGDMLSRVTSIMDGSGPIVDYVYLGLGTFVQVDYPEPGIRYDLAFGSGSNPYAGLDNFGRVIDCRWRTVSTGSDVERIQYGYDLASNRTWRHNTVAPNGGNDELYTYDGLQRLVNFQRGTFSGSSRTAITSQTLQQQWNLDTTGNWSQFASSDSLDSSNSVNQSRTHTLSNEIESFRANSGTAWAQPVYDSAGNMVIFPQPAAPASPYIATYDAWNRMVSVAGIATYDYDGANRRATKTISGTVRHFYYSLNWQALEERLGSSTSPDRQFFWGLRYIDDLALRDRGSERLYSLQDANWNVTAILDTSGEMQERYRYTAYGVPAFLDSSFDIASYTASSFDWETLYAGYRWNSSVQLYGVRHRAFLAAVGTWATRDLAGYDVRGSFYAYALTRPADLVDPSGLEPPSIQACTCGPDVTAVFLRALQRGAKRLKALPSSETGLIDGLRFLQRNGINIDFRVPPVTGCGTGTCAGTVMLAGTCINAFQLNNILYGLVGRYVTTRFSFWDIVAGGNAHQLAAHHSLESTVQRSSYALGWQFPSMDGDIYSLTEAGFAAWASNEQWWFENTVSVGELFNSGTLLERIGNFGEFSGCVPCGQTATEKNVSYDFTTVNWYGSGATSIPAP
jgi:RHS repeat-associated protein